MKHITHLLSCLIMISLILAGCNLPQQATTTPSTPDPDQVSTQVQKLLTQIPTQTPQVLPTLSVPTATQPPEEEEQEPTQEPTEKPTEKPTPAPATPTKSTTDPRETLGEPTWSDNLDSGSAYTMYTDDHVKISAANGTISMTAFNADGWHSWTLSNPKLTDFYYEVTAKPGACSGDDRYGIVVRSPANNKGYVYGFSCDGEYSLRIWNGEKFITITDWTESDAIESGANQTNRVGVMVDGSQFTFYANGTRVGEVQDSTYTDSGKIGLFIASSKTDDFTVQFDEAAYWTLP